MRRLIPLVLLLLTLCLTPACAESYTDYAALAEAFNAATEDTTLTLDADLVFVEGGSCILNNPTKATITIDGNGHSIDFLGMLDGTLVLQNVKITEKAALSSPSKKNTTSLTIGADAVIGAGPAGGISIPSDAQGAIHIRNEGMCRQISSVGCAAKIRIENTGLIEAVLGISISDQRRDDHYKLCANGDVTIVNDGLIRGLTSAGVFLAPNGGTDVTITGSGTIEGPIGVVVCCQQTRANVTIDQNIRTCNARFIADPAEYADLWRLLGERGVELGLPRTTGDKTLTPEYQRSFRIAQLDLLFKLTACTGEDVLGYALVLPQTDDIPYNGKVTVTGTLYGENGLIVLPDMNLFKGAITIKSAIDAASSAQLVDIHYVRNVGSITAEKWGKSVQSIVKKVFPSGLPESVTVRTWGIRHDADTDGLVYTTGWQGYAMDELRATQSGGKGKWRIATTALPSPGGSMTRYELGEKLSKAPNGTIMLLENDVACGSPDDYYNWYTFAGDDIVIDGQGHHFCPIEDEAKRRGLYPVEYTMKKNITVRNFTVYDGLKICSGKYTKGTAVLENITDLRGLWLQGVNAELHSVVSQNNSSNNISITNASKYAKKATVTLDENTQLYGFADISVGGNSDRVNSLTIVNNGVISCTGTAWNGSLHASTKGTLKITGSGMLGDFSNNDPDREHYDVRAYSGGKIAIDHNVANLNVIAGVNKDSFHSAQGSVTIGGRCRFLTIECDDNAQQCSITVTATGLEVFRVLMEIDGRTEPMTDKEASGYIRKNGPKLTCKNAAGTDGNRIFPSYRITGEGNVVLWEGQVQ